MYLLDEAKMLETVLGGDQGLLGFLDGRSSDGSGGSDGSSGGSNGSGGREGGNNSEEKDRSELGHDEESVVFVSWSGVDDLFVEIVVFF